MNGVLISLEEDPTTEAELDRLFATPKRHGRAAAYVERIRFTPPELRGDFHSRALARWQGLQAERRQAPGASAPRRAEPSPRANIGVWKRWLKDSREPPQSGGTFKYVGIPLVGQGYQTVHIEGTRALLSFFPLTIKGATVRGLLRDAFLRAAAALLCVPERYTQVLAQLGQGIAQGRRALYYDKGRFGTAANFGVNEMARFLASVGVTSDVAEQRRPWATAFVEMELNARARAH